MPDATHKSGFAALVGRPNAGKSTLINRLVGEKVSIVAAAPQTTRNRILGVVNRPDGQIVLVDTPGIHKPLSRLNEQMMNFVRQALEDQNLAVLIVDASARFGGGDEYSVELIRRYKPRAILALNKIDVVRKTSLLPLIARYAKLYEWEEVIPISALKGDGVEELLEAVIRLLPEGPPFYPPDMYTDQPQRFLASEIIREKVIAHTRMELPYVTAVLIEELKEGEALTRIGATVLVEKESQKPIIIGAGGQRIKDIGTEARAELEKLFPPKVFLELFVRVEPDWRNNRGTVGILDYRNEAQRHPQRRHGVQEA